ncbi:MAG TPA: phospholipid carrier-dependent glycosyltransferase [Candidatus Andersenbacteria bacterium]|nr:phospholipid carrier-dependent glycosyltransferase [Candidatus Andersenbacteria bacterium]
MNVRHDITIFLGILLLAACTRVFFLSYIPQVVFDEVHFGKFISAYCCTHQRFFDIHPPVGKLLIAAGAYLSGYNGLFPFEYIGQPFVNVPIDGVRMVPALFGTLLAGIIYILLRLMNVSKLFSVLGGIAIALDNALIVESRFILMDNILLVMTFGCIAAGIAAVKTRAHSLQSLFFVILAGILAGAAMGTKFTGMIAGGLVVLLFLAYAYHEGPKKYLQWGIRCLVLACSALIIYLGAWAIHFSLLTLPGSGDVWGIPTGNFVPDLISLHQEMISANYNLTATHPYGSKWWTWPFMIRPVFYWQGNTGNQFIYLLGNPAVWWGGFVFFCIALLALIASIIKKQYKHSSNIVWIMIIGYLWAYVPLMRVPRVLFLYHYLTPLIFSLIIALWWLDRTVKLKRQFVAIAALCIIAGFIYISPLTYGYPISSFWQTLLFSIQSWR